MEKQPQAPQIVSKKINRARRWIPEFPLKADSNFIPIKVLSYNILADSNIKYTLNYYPDSYPHLEWRKKRFPMILEYFINTANLLK